MSETNPPEQVTVTDKRRIDPETGQVRHVASGAAPSGAAPEAAAIPASAGAAADKVVELTADLQRVQADYANYRKRALRDQEAIAERAKATVVSQLLGVLDDLDRARSHGDLESGPLKLVADKLLSVLTGLGLTAFGAEGDGADGSKPVIGSVMRHGYKLGDQVLRHALVGVVDTIVDDASEAAAGETETVDTVDNDANEGEHDAESEPSEK